MAFRRLFAVRRGWPGMPWAISRREAPACSSERASAGDVMELTREYLENKRSLDAFTEEWSVQMEKLDN